MFYFHRFLFNIYSHKKWNEERKISYKMFLKRKNKRNLHQVHRHQLLCRMFWNKKKCTIQTDRHRKINNNNKPLCEGFFPQTPYPFTHEHRQQKLKPIVHTHTYTLSTFRDRIEQPQNRIKVHNTITKIQFVWQHSQYTSNPTIFMERVWSKRKN